MTPYTLSIVNEKEYAGQEGVGSITFGRPVQAVKIHYHISPGKEPCQ
jgi:hypothetical protein